MDRDDIQIIVAVLTVALGCVFSGYKIGRHLENKFWVDSIPKEMSKLCLDCARMRDNNFIGGSYDGTPN